MSRTLGMESIVEIHENERYWVGNGFGKGGLLPNDRGPFTSTDGSLSWKTPELASEDALLLGRGWVYYKSGDGFEVTPSHGDSDGWLYATDFRAESLNSAQPKQGPLHFVRFRRLARVKLFNPEEVVERDVFEECDHCDSSAIASLSKLLLDILAYTSLLHSSTSVTDSVLLPLKKKVVDHAIEQSTPSLEDNSDSFYQLDKLRKKLENFVEKERSDTSLSRILGGVDFSFYGRSGKQEFVARCGIIASRCFPQQERDAIAGLIVRKLDKSYQVHCNKIACGNSCRFANMQCPNEGCSATMSKIYLEKHQTTCSHRTVQCECGDTLKALELSGHLSHACKLRVVACPFKHIGCIKEVKAGELEEHITDDSAAHLLLAVGRLGEQQRAIQNLQSAVEALTLQNKELSNALQTQMVNTTKEFSQLQKTVTKTSKDLGRLETTCTKEFKKINSPRHQLS